MPYTQSNATGTINFTTVATAALFDQSEARYDQFIKERPWLAYINAKCRVTEDGGELIKRTVRFGENTNIVAFEKNDTLQVNFGETRLPIVYNFKNVAGGIIVAAEDLIITKTSSFGPALDLLAEEVEWTQRGMNTALNRWFLGDGTAQDGKVPNGLQALVSTTPTVNSLAGLDRASYTFWRNAAYNVATYAAADGATASWANYGINGIKDDLPYIAKIAITDGAMSPDLMLSGPTLQMYYSHQVLNDFVQVDKTTYDIGFPAVQWGGLTWLTDKMLDDTSVHPAGTLYMLNTRTLELVVSDEWNMTSTGFKDLTANMRLAMIAFILFRCNLIITQPMYNAVIYGYTCEA